MPDFDPALLHDIRGQLVVTQIKVLTKKEQQRLGTMIDCVEAVMGMNVICGKSGCQLGNVSQMIIEGAHKDNMSQPTRKTERIRQVGGYQFKSWIDEIGVNGVSDTSFGEIFSEGFVRGYKQALNDLRAQVLEELPELEK